VLFDAGNTLVYLEPERMAEILRAAGAPADRASVQHAELEARRLLHDAIDQGHNGTEPHLWRRYFARVFELAGVPEASMAEAGRLLRAVHAEDHLWTHVVPGTAHVLHRMSDQGLRLGVISNADGRMEAVLERVGLRRHFEFVVDSGVVGVEKPDARIFLTGCERLGLAPEQCLYVGDLLPVDYLGAVAAGLHAVLLDPLGLHVGRAHRITGLEDLPGFLAAGAYRFPPTALPA
jgi:putative hydrolase of the HAD superfamily